MKDLVDEKNFREKLEKSIIKWWNVNMMIPGAEVDKTEEISEEEKIANLKANMSEEEKQMADEVLKRLNEEAWADEQKKAKEIEEAIFEQQKEKENSYNATTGSYSGEYGKNEIEDDEAKDQIAKILKEKEDSVMKSIEELTANVD